MATVHLFRGMGPGRGDRENRAARRVPVCSPGMPSPPRAGPRWRRIRPRFAVLHRSRARCARGRDCRVAGLQPPPRTAVPGGTFPPARVSAAPRAGAPASGLGGQVAASVASRVAERMAAVSARGPEYEAVAKLSKEIIEKIAWEIVPELAEAIIREELQKRGRI